MQSRQLEKIEQVLKIAETPRTENSPAHCKIPEYPDANHIRCQFAKPKQLETDHKDLPLFIVNIRLSFLLAADTSVRNSVLIQPKVEISRT